MSCQNPGCLGNYDFNHIVFFAKKRFVEGCNTIDLLVAAKTEREKEEIALVCLLHLEDEAIRDLQLSCNYAEQCKTIDCRDRLKIMIKEELGKTPH